MLNSVDSRGANEVKDSNRLPQFIPTAINLTDINSPSVGQKENPLEVKVKKARRA